MRYLRAAFVALAGAVLIAVAVTAIGGTRCQRVGIADGHPVCHAAVQSGGREAVFVAGFGGVFVWFLRGRRRIPGL